MSVWKRLRSTAPNHSETTLIASGAIVDGVLRFAGILEVEGRINGDILVVGDDQSVVRILQGGYVGGNILAPVVIVNGTVTGNICAGEHVELAAHAIINGDVRYSLLEMTKGAQVNGRLIFEAESDVFAALVGGKDTSVLGAENATIIE
jgi:cytoskeletal protein CcmA (bactofilin family)